MNEVRLGGKIIRGGNASVSGELFPDFFVEVRLPREATDQLLYGNHIANVHTRHEKWVATKVVVECYSIKWKVDPSFDHAFLAKCNSIC